MIKRRLEQKLRKYAEGFPVIALVGPRQSGKTTLVRNVFTNLPYVSLENPDMRNLAETDPKGFLTSYKDGAVFDEIQKTPVLFSYLQQIVDENNLPGRFILSGSQNFLMVEKITQSLAGRVGILKLLPFDMHELKNADRKFSSLDETIFKGFYPRLFEAKIAPEDFYSSYIHTYVERDVREFKNISDLSVFQKFLRICAARAGQILNFTSIANECDISLNTAKAWVSLLEASFIIFQLKPYYKNFNKQLVKSPKLYFYDSGILCSLLGLRDYKQLFGHYFKGAIFENMIVSDLVKRAHHEGIDPKYFFWRDKTGHEVDIIEEKISSLVPIEIKSSMTIGTDYLNGIKYLKKVLEGKSVVENGTVIYGGEEDLKLGEGRVVGWKKF